MKRMIRKTFFPILFSLDLGCSALRCAAADASPSPGPATVTNALKESALTTVTLTEQAVKRLGIETARVETKQVQRARLFGGELIVPWDELDSVETLSIASVSEGAASNEQTLFSLRSTLTAGDTQRIAQLQIEADGKIEEAEARLATAELAAKRALALADAEAGSLRRTEEAKLDLALAQVALKTARRLRKFLGPEILPPSTPGRLWARVPIPVATLRTLDADSEARVARLGGSPERPTLLAKPVGAPPAANPQTATIDLVYEIGETEEELRVGERVGFHIPIRSATESRVLPWSSVVYDIQGGAWVYEKTGPLSFARRRVQVRYVSDAIAPFFDEPGAQDRDFLRNALADGSHGIGALDDTAPFDGDSGSRKRPDLGTARPAVSGSNRSGPLKR